ncbi:hypothetical protein MPTK1_6g14760 [Marchantia polymorpha subsp. ruderalis]|uniref:Uncharacterized protein n=2 Tax=Marchantia polymorpha TaxID=3197 RepID=A0AAF6BS38_MARPO|nr:hypothetical protein MARPO_0047s0130 [Marchantia polymorpha]BBN14822.1 hypothetical protein Mp_6g14760 [Marchantia polymorpha subsp. ruderalis]|eukprot:PTQ39166.1 hypothetical protein MARPO_0047s0130 [Marchantia polymorpha]
MIEEASGRGRAGRKSSLVRYPTVRGGGGKKRVGVGTWSSVEHDAVASSRQRSGSRGWRARSWGTGARGGGGSTSRRRDPGKGRAARVPQATRAGGTGRAGEGRGSLWCGKSSTGAWDPPRGPASQPEGECETERASDCWSGAARGRGTGCKGSAFARSSLSLQLLRPRANRVWDAARERGEAEREAGALVVSQWTGNYIGSLASALKAPDTYTRLSSCASSLASSSSHPLQPSPFPAEQQQQLCSSSSSCSSSVKVACLCGPTAFSLLLLPIERHRPSHHRGGLHLLSRRRELGTLLSRHLQLDRTVVVRPPLNLSGKR